MPSSIVGLSSDSENGGHSWERSKCHMSDRSKTKARASPQNTPLTRYTEIPSKMYDNSTVLGALAGPEHDFCPYAAVAKYPYKYLHPKWAEEVSQVFFAHGLLQARGWTIYYVYSPLSDRPVKFIPTLEFEALLEDMGKRFSTTFKAPDVSTEPGFIVNFADCGNYRPRYLGRLDNSCDMTELDARMPSPTSINTVSLGRDGFDRSFAAFKAKMEAVIEATKNKSKKQKEKKKNQRIEHKTAMYDRLGRAQRYLGLLDSKKGVFHSDVIFIALDVEVWERDHRTITEIGITSLDTRDLHSLDPAENGSAWMDSMRPRHFRIREASHLNNFQFVTGCADRFEKQFGESEWVSKKDLAALIGSCFRNPFSAPFSISGGVSFPTADNHDNTGGEDHEKRNIVLVGHDIQADIQYLRDFGYELANLPNILEAIDTADLFKALKQEWQSASLGSVLLDLGLTGWNLHNAGNDAAYTMQCLLLISLRSAHTSIPDRLASASITRSAQIATAAQDAQAQILADADEWEVAAASHVRTGGDGGHPVPIVPRLSTQRSKGGKERKQSGSGGKNGRLDGDMGVSEQVKALSNLDVSHLEGTQSPSGTEAGEQSGDWQMADDRSEQKKVHDEVSARLRHRLARLDYVEW